MLQNIKELLGFVVEGTDGSIGRIHDLYFDDRDWTIRFLVVETGTWLEGRKVLISPVAINETDWARRLLPVSVTREQVKNSPDVDSQKPVSRQHEVENYAYYGYPYYWGGSGIWGDSMQPGTMLAAYRGAKSPSAAGSGIRRGAGAGTPATWRRSPSAQRACNGSISHPRDRR